MENDWVLTVQTGIGIKARKVKIFKGHEYIISPLNPKKMKNRGRHVVVHDKVLYTPGHENGDYVARVQYLDNNRWGRVDFGELEPVDVNDLAPIS